MTRYFTKDHEWLDVAGDTATVGITDYAQGQLGDVVFVELPPVGTVLVQGKDAAVVESVKAASDIYSPVGGTVIEINPATISNPPDMPNATQCVPKVSNPQPPSQELNVAPNW